MKLVSTATVPLMQNGIAVDTAAVDTPAAPGNSGTETVPEKADC